MKAQHPTAALRTAIILSTTGLLYCASAKAEQGPSSADLIGFSRSMEALASGVSPAIVEIHASGYGGVEAARTGRLVKSQSTGSGVLVSADGYIVTNSHVVLGARRIEVVTTARDGRPWKGSILPPAKDPLVAEVVGVDLETDLAVLKVSGKHPSLELADSDELRNGQVVMAFGSPFGLEGSVSMGVISSVARQLRPEDEVVYIQTDAPINPGNSGGPLVDAKGKVVGINTFIISRSGGSQGLGFAVPSNIVRSVYEQLKKDGQVRRGIIGVNAQTITPELARGLSLPRSFGVILADVYPNGPAAKAGLKPGDVVVSLDGKLMENGRQMIVNLYGKKIGSEVEIEVLRGTTAQTHKVGVVERNKLLEGLQSNIHKPEHLVPAMGVAAIEISEEIAKMMPGLRVKSGVLVVLAEGGLLRGRSGLVPGDVIHSLNGVGINSLAALREQLDKSRPGDAVVLGIERGGQLRYSSVVLD